MDDLDANIIIETTLYFFLMTRVGLMWMKIRCYLKLFYNVEFDNLHVDIGISLESFNNGECG